MIKSIIKNILPPFIIKGARMLFPYQEEEGEKGSILFSDESYKTWEEVEKLATGNYDQDLILNYVKSTMRKVVNKEIAYERDSVEYDSVQFPWPLLSCLQKVSPNAVNIIDFGGGLGSTYHQCRAFLEIPLSWHIVEQSHFAKCGNEEFKTDELDFYDDLKRCHEATKANVLLASCVLPYLSDPLDRIKSFIETEVDYIIIDRTQFIDGSDHIVKLQTVSGNIYDASYPAYFFNYSKFVELFEGAYDLLAEFDSYCDTPGIIGGKKVEFKGMLFRRKGIK